MLTSWANLYGAKYKDQAESESQAQTREQTHLRLQEAIEEEHDRSRPFVLADRTAEAQSAADMARIEDENRRDENGQPEPASDQAEDVSGSEFERQTAARSREAAAREAFRQAAERVRQTAAQEPFRHAPERPEEVRAQQVVDYPAPPEQPKAPSAQVSQQVQTEIRDALQRAAALPVAAPSHLAAARTENLNSLPEAPTDHFDSRDSNRSIIANPRIANPGIANPGIANPGPITNPGPKQSTYRPAKEDAPQDSRGGLGSRWFALRSVFDFGGAPVPEPAPASPPAPAPVVALFSLAGGIGKTSLAATLGRALSARGERVLLVDTAVYGLMPFFFGAQDHRPGVLRTFSPQGTVGDSPIQMLALDAESLGPENGPSDPLVGEIGKYSRGVNRVIVDLATASGVLSRRVMKLSPTMLVPIIPDMNSVVSVGSIDSFFQHHQNGSSAGKPSLPFYVLNRFEPTLALHRDIREVLHQQLGERLLPFVLHRNPAIPEALAEGMTVMDYAPDSAAAVDFGTLADWVKNQSAPAPRTSRGVRWSER